MIDMEVELSSERPNSESEKQDLENLNGKGRDVAEEPLVSIGADLPQEEAGSSVVKKRKRKKDKGISALIIDGCDPLEKVSAENNSPHGTETVHEEPLVDVISGSKRKKKRKKSTIGAAPDSENSCLEMSAGICTTPNSEKAEQHVDVLPLLKKKSLKIHEYNDRSCESPRKNEEQSYSPEKMKKKKKKMRKTHESSYNGDPSVGTSLVEDITPTVDQSVQPPASVFSEQELEVAQPPIDGISTNTKRKKKKKLKKEGKTHESNDESYGNAKGRDLSAAENSIPGIDSSQQPPVSESSEQKLELPQPLTEGISAKTNPESSEFIADLISPSKRKKKNRKKRGQTHESNNESCANDKICELSSGTSLVENIMPEIDTSKQLPISEFSEQKRELPQALMEGISMTASSEGPKPNTDLNCSQEKKKRKKKRKVHEIIDERCDLSVGTSSGGSVLPGVDLSEQPQVAIFSEQVIEVEQPLAEQIRQRIDSESPKDSEDLSCSQKTKKRKRKKKCKNHESNDNSSDPSAGTSLVEKVPQLLLEESTLREKNDGKELNKDQNGLQNCADGGSRNKIDTEVDCVSREQGNIKTHRRNNKVQNDLGCLEENGVKGTSLHCSNASPEAEDITDTERTGTRIKAPSFAPLAIKADVDLAVVVKEGNISQTSDFAERSLVTCPKRKLLILDVNGLLADIVQMEDVIPKKFKPDTIVSRKKVFRRPYCKDFLQFCFDRFNVGIWSSRNKKNVNLVIKFLLGDLRDKLVFCWDQSHCTKTKFSTLDNKNKPIVLKEVRKLWEKVDPDLPWGRGEYNESNTIMVDDSPYKALRNPVNTAVFPYPYKYRNKGDKSLGPGGDIRCYLEELLKADNVQKYVEKHPFGQRPITKSSRSWDFYSKVLEDGVPSE